MLGLADQIRRNDVWIGGSIRKDQAVGWSRDHIDANAAKEDAFGFGDVLIAGTCKDIGAGQAEQAECHRGDALHAAHRQNSVGAAQVGGKDDCGRQACAGARW